MQIDLPIGRLHITQGPFYVKEHLSGFPALELLTACSSIKHVFLHDHSLRWCRLLQFCEFTFCSLSQTLLHFILILHIWCKIHSFPLEICCILNELQSNVLFFFGLLLLHARLWIKSFMYKAWFPWLVIVYGLQTMWTTIYFYKGLSGTISGWMCSFFSVSITLEFCIVLCWDQYATHYGARNLDNTLSIQTLSIWQG